MMRDRKAKFFGCYLDPEDAERVEMELSRRIAGGQSSSRADLIRQAIRQTYPATDTAGTNHQTAS